MKKIIIKTLCFFCLFITFLTILYYSIVLSDKYYFRPQLLKEQEAKCLVTENIRDINLCMKWHIAFDYNPQIVYDIFYNLAKKDKIYLSGILLNCAHQDNCAEKNELMYFLFKYTNEFINCDSEKCRRHADGDDIIKKLLIQCVRQNEEKCFSYLFEIVSYRKIFTLNKIEREQVCHQFPNDKNEFCDQK